MPIEPINNEEWLQTINASKGAESVKDKLNAIMALANVIYQDISDLDAISRYMDVEVATLIDAQSAMSGQQRKLIRVTSDPDVNNNGLYIYYGDNDSSIDGKTLLTY